MIICYAVPLSIVPMPVVVFCYLGNSWIYWYILHISYTQNALLHRLHIVRQMCNIIMCHTIIL